MTIVFQGHVESISTAIKGKVAVKLITPMEEADGAEWIVYVPQEHAKNWLPGSTVVFTMYTLVSEVIGKALAEHEERSKP